MRPGEVAARERQSRQNVAALGRAESVSASAGRRYQVGCLVPFYGTSWVVLELLQFWRHLPGNCPLGAPHPGVLDPTGFSNSAHVLQVGFLRSSWAAGAAAFQLTADFLQDGRLLFSSPARVSERSRPFAPAGLDAAEVDSILHLDP